ncbi:MAG: ABC transporter permease, partial [Desulfurococcaceae archaeon]
MQCWPPIPGASGMSLWSLAFRNLRRRRLRTSLTASGIAIGIGMMFVPLSLTSGMEAQARTMIRGLTGADIVVYNASRIGGFRGDASDSMLGPATLSTSTLAALAAIPGVYAAAPQLSFSGYMEGRRITIYGVEPASYGAVTGGLNIVEGRLASQSGEAVLGRTLAELMNVAVGREVEISAGQAKRAFTIVGIFETGVSFQEYAAYMTLSDAQELSGMEGATQILVKCEDPSMARDVADAISSAIPQVRTMVPTAQLQQASQVLSSLTMFFATIGLVALCAGALGTVNTMMMSIFERTREIGILKSLGAGSGDVMKVFLAESLVIGALGGAVGVAAGLIISYAFPTFSSMLLG